MKKKKQLQQGVTLIEMLVVIAIFGVVASILFFNYADFNNSVSTRNLAQDIGLAIRKAQTYATSVRKLDASGNTTSAPAYGISFSATQDQPTAAQIAANPSFSILPTKKQFILFADQATDPTATGSAKKITDLEYRAGTACGTPKAGDECLEVFKILTSDYISDIVYSTTVDGTANLTSIKDQARNTTTPIQANIVFHRPSPDAVFCIFINDACVSGVSYVKIEVSSIKGLKRNVVIWNTGQISVQ